MAAETTLPVSYETRDDVRRILHDLMRARGGKSVTWDEAVRELLAAHAELRKILDQEAS